MPRDTLLVFRHTIGPVLRSPATILISMVQTILYLVLFGPLLEDLVRVPGAANSWQVFAPGILVQLALFTGAFAGFALLPDLRAGVVERMRVTPVSRTALLLGRVLRDVVVTMAQAVLLLLAATALGMRAPLVGVVLGLLLAAVLAGALSAASYTMALALPNEYQFAPVVQSVTLPLMLLSGVLLPIAFGPDWLRAVSKVNPLTYAVDAERALFVGDYGATDVLTGVTVVLVVFGLTVLWGTRSYRRQNA
ncbi:ABC-2 type transport system permease protein [Streptoalloteichus tenebrarius]|uniref:Transport permease protein n=1 Tax=Streptoalloteichus tenebrarius (strain ATCC 17920 / DSM 40477 / JCM 4838 / CBS 697.72 / NBRC 16177 / NCIMB 11028 / NRRL B-12390 / A12253. 1 / ISP 5477) TaxID=1933 RepID=A0ABT1I442_STRSD|nr:ABC transporter permease [Streptoalloteichus tenebrarius]MCP2262532.1 ABC-2 type transport system permease protein [Streptoalloteichus tenebrarius]BFF01239.1 ABC transporter permease [Streptoalloteichus tenebrarius]